MLRLVESLYHYSEITRLSNDISCTYCVVNYNMTSLIGIEFFTTGTLYVKRRSQLLRENAKAGVIINSYYVFISNILFLCIYCAKSQTTTATSV